MDAAGQELERPSEEGERTAAVRRRRRMAMATGGSMLLHGTVLAAALWSVTSNSFSGGAGAAGGEGQAVTVTLVGPLGGSIGQSRASAAQSSGAELSNLVKKFQDVPSLITAADQPTRRGDADQLFKEISASRSKAAQDDRHTDLAPGQGAGENGQARQTAKAKGADNKAVAVEGHADERGDTGHATGDMWGEIETCWRPVAPVPITLEVVINTSGGLALPPRILRPAGAPVDEKRLRAEASAVQAVADCAPFRSGAPVFGVKTYRFAFNPRN